MPVQIVMNRHVISPTTQALFSPALTKDHREFLNMTVILTAAKVLASTFLIALLIAGIFKANPRTHNSKYGHRAEYVAGFIICMTAVLGLYHLWK